MKKLLLSLTLALAVAGSASAAQIGQVDRSEHQDFKYPLFTQLKPAAEKLMNSDIKKMLDEAREDLKFEGMQTVGSNYEVIFEDDKYVCLSLITWSYEAQAIHPNHYYHGLVYDKTTGKRVPYTQFVPALDAAKFKQDIADKKYTVYCADMKTVSDTPFLKYMDDFAVSDEYIIDGDGHLYIVYQTYDLDCYAAGPTFVKIK